VPNDPAKRFQRKGLIRERIKTNDKRVQKILLDSKARVDSAIKRAANDPKFATSAGRREKLYKEINALYGDMSGDVKGWANKAAETTGREAFRFAQADVGKANIKVNFNQFSRKHIEDWVSVVNPSSAPQLAAVSSLATQDVRWLREQFVDVFRESNVTGATMRELQKDLKSRVLSTRPDWAFVDSAGRKWKPDNYFNMLSRTTVATVERNAYQDAIGEAGVDLVQVAGGPPTAPPPDPCWDWFDKILSVTGATRGFSTVAEAESDGLFHPNCCVPEMLVHAPDLKGATRFRYSGDLVHIKLASGNTLAVTPQHMFLTPRGFVAAHDLLSHIDHIISSDEAKGAGLGGPDVNGQPSSIADVFMASQKSLSVATRQMPMASEYFHGDGHNGYGYVDVVSAYGFLRDHAETMRDYPLSKHHLIAGDIKAHSFSRNRSLATLLLRAGLASDRIVCSRSDLLAKRRATFSQSDLDLFSLRSGLNPSSDESLSHGHGGTGESIGQFIQAFSGSVSLDQVVSVDVSSYTGHVYDLHSVSTLYYINGTLSSNCIHYLAAVLPDEVPDAEAREQRADVSRATAAQDDLKKEAESKARQKERDATLKEERLENLRRGQAQARRA